MSLTIIKAGILDTIQDGGRFGYQALGINPNGAMDVFAASLANCLLGKPMDAPVIEMHFPAPVIVFNNPTVICITGANFTPTVNNLEIPINHAVMVNEGTRLQFEKVKHGARCYISVLNTRLQSWWLNSYSTNLTAKAGGLRGDRLKNGDIIGFEAKISVSKYLKDEPLKVLSWTAHIEPKTPPYTIEVIRGSEWDWLDENSKQTFLESSFLITKDADRMGFRLSGGALTLKNQQQLVSSAVTFGTVQLLPSGQLIVLMADHQTTGGYPRVANVISAHLPILAQSKHADKFTFAITEIENAEEKLWRKYNYLLQVQESAGFKIEKFLQ